MFKKYFKNKTFMFIFSFALNVIIYMLFFVFQIAGRFNIPDMALSPVLGLMFGPVGGAGMFFATFSLNFLAGHDIIISFLDAFGLFFISVLSYKLWYSIFKDKKLGVPRFNSVNNILKFIVVISVGACFYEIWINLLFGLCYSSMVDLYTDYSVINRFIYGFDFFNYAIIYGFLFISFFNFFKIPFYAPLNKKLFGEISSRYFLLFLIFVLAYCVINLVYDFSLTVDLAVVVLTVFVLIVYCINSVDVDLDLVFEEYSIIEKIILVFIAIISISVVMIFQDMQDMFRPLSVLGFNVRAVSLITYFIFICILLILVMIHIHFVEKVLINPINELIEAVNVYAANKRKIDQSYFTSKFDKYLKDNDDISKLLKSFMHLRKNIKKNLDELTRTTIEKERFETEFNIASKIQADMLPTDFEDFSDGKGFEIYAYMNPAREVGGDFYDYFGTDDDNISFVIGDVSGKGIPATLFMVKTMHLIKNHSFYDNKLSDVFYNVNNLSCQRNDRNLFVTSWLAKLNLKSGELSYVNAGHNAPLIRQNNGDFEYFDTPHNLVLGGIEDVPYNDYAVNLKPGDMVFLYTDGVTEANSDYHGFYGEDRLKETINKFKDESLNIIITKIKDDINSFCDNQDQYDDMTMLILKYNGGDDNE